MDMVRRARGKEQVTTCILVVGLWKLCGQQHIRMDATGL